MFDLCDHEARAVPGGGLVLEAAVADERRVTRSAARPGEEVLDPPLEHVVGGQPNGVAHSTAFERLVERRYGERGVRPNRSMVGSRTSSHPSALWTLPGRSLAAGQLPSGLKTKS